MDYVRRWAAPSSLLVAVLLIACAYRWLPHATYMSLVRVLVDDAAPAPFIDTHVFLAWAECHGRGIDVFVTNPCDMLGRTLAQSPLWLMLAYVGANVGWTDMVGALLGLCCLGSLFWLPPAPSARAAVIVAASFWSPPLAFALERGNTDLLVFVCVVLAARLSLRGEAARNWGYAAALFAGLLKFYPLAALAIALKEPPRRFWRITALCVGPALVLILVYWEDWPRIAIQKDNWFGLTFGAVNLPAGLATLAPGWDWLRSLVVLCCLAPGVVSAVLLFRRRQAHAALHDLSPLEAAFLLVGAALVVASFVSSMNGAYRAMFIILTIAPLLRLAARTDGRPFRAAVCVAVFLMWWFKLHLLVIDLAPALGRGVALAFGGANMAEPVAVVLILASWLVNQMAWWWFAAMMLTVLMAFACGSPPAIALFRRRVGQGLADGSGAGGSPGGNLHM